MSIGAAFRNDPGLPEGRRDLGLAQRRDIAHGDARRTPTRPVAAGAGSGARRA